MKLSKNQIEILDHTVNRAANNMFCGSSIDMCYLVDLGLMKNLGTKSFVPDDYYGITNKGREALKEQNNYKTLRSIYE